MKSRTLVVLVLALVAAACSGRGAVPGTPSSAANPVTTLFIADDGPDIATPAPVGARLTGEHSITNSHYGFILGYFNGRTSLTSEVVHLTAGTQVKFFNVDSVLPHTVSFLGKATAASALWPRTFNGSSIRSPAGTAIGALHFSTGSLNPGQSSLIYRTGLPGFYMEGCAFHYDSNKMRTVIIVH